MHTAPASFSHDVFAMSPKLRNGRFTLAVWGYIDNSLLPDLEYVFTKFDLKNTCGFSTRYGKDRLNTAVL